MTVSLHNIPGLDAPQGFSHAMVARGTALVHISGQGGFDDSGAIVEGGLAAQVERALLNVVAALEAAGGTTDDLAKLTYYVVNWEPSMFEDLASGVRAARAKQPLADVASTRGPGRAPGIRSRSPRRCARASSCESASATCCAKPVRRSR